MRSEGQLTDRQENFGGIKYRPICRHSQVALMDDDMDFAEASLLACGVLTGWGAVVNTAKVPPGASVAVVGCGGVGANCLQAANITQAEPVVAVEIVIAPAELFDSRAMTETDQIIRRKPSCRDFATWRRRFWLCGVVFCLRHRFCRLLTLYYAITIAG